MGYWGGWKLESRPPGLIHTGPEMPRAAQCKQIQPVVVNGSVHTACKQHQRKNIPICARVLSRVLCEKGPIARVRLLIFRSVPSLQESWLLRRKTPVIKHIKPNFWTCCSFLCYGDGELGQAHRMSLVYFSDRSVLRSLNSRCPPFFFKQTPPSSKTVI